MLIGLVFVIGFTLIHPSFSFASATNDLEKALIIVNPVLTSNDSNQELTDAIKKVEMTSYEENSDGSITEGYEVDVSIPTSEFAPFDSAGGSKTEGLVKATLNITYTMRNSNQQIKISSISGGWTRENNQVVVSNREASVNDGRPIPKIKRWYPTSNTFNYNTDWDFVNYYPGTDYTGVRGYTNARLTVSGMNSYYDLMVTVAVNR